MLNENDDENNNFLKYTLFLRNRNEVNIISSFSSVFIQNSYWLSIFEEIASANKSLKQKIKQKKCVCRTFSKNEYLQFEKKIQKNPAQSSNFSIRKSLKFSEILEIGYFCCRMYNRHLQTLR